MNNSLRIQVDKLGEIVSKLIPIPYTGTPLDESLRSQQIIVKYFSDKRYDAFLVWNYEQERPVIAVNSLEYPVRRNFSMAHELGHLILNYQWSPFSHRCKASHNKVLATEYRGANYTVKQMRNEHIVDEFAASFLMPTYLIKQIIKNDNQRYTSIINDITSRFKVSKLAAKKRINIINNI